MRPVMLKYLAPERVDAMNLKRLAISISVVVILITSTSLTGVNVLPETSAHVDPSGCGANNLILNIASFVTAASVNYKVEVKNPDASVPPGCNVTNLLVTFNPFKSDGTVDTGTTIKLCDPTAGGQTPSGCNFPAGNSQDTVYFSGVGGKTCAALQDGFPNCKEVAGLNRSLAGVTANSVTSRASANPNNLLAEGTVHKSTNDNLATITKEVTDPVTTFFLKTDSSSTGNVLRGSSVHDTANLTSNTSPITGNLNFFLCGPGTVDVTGCPTSVSNVFSDSKGVKAASPAIVISANFVVPSNALTGKYCWRAEFTGNGTFTGVSQSGTNSTSECFTVISATMQTTPSKSTAFPGDSVTDKADFTKSPASAPDVKGNVKFSICTPSQLTPVNTGVCSSGGVQVGLIKAVSGSPGSATSDGFTVPSTPGKYCWRGDFTGSGNYAGLNLTDSNPTECFTVQTVTMSTTPTKTAVSAKDNVTDTANVTPSTATGNVTFFVCTPSQLTPANTGVCASGSGAQVGSAKSVLGGTATSDKFTVPNVPGKYCFRSVFNGTGSFNGVTVDASSDPNECFFFTVGGTPVIIIIEED